MNTDFITNNNKSVKVVIAKNYFFVRKFGRKGKGDGKFNSPTNIAIDLFGQVYVSDSGNHCIQVFSHSIN